MKRVGDMTGRLPALYREGDTVQRLLAQPGVQIEIVDEYAARVQRAHWFDETFELDEAAGLAALLDFAPEGWQTLDLFRTWVHVNRDASLLHGATTPAGLQRFLTDYTRGYKRATEVEFEQVEPTLVEYPQRRRYAVAPVTGDLTPLSRLSIEMKGLDETNASFLLTGLASGPESMPVIVNLTTGEGLLWSGQVAPGQRLWIQATAAGSMSARLEREDVTSRLRSLTGIVPGSPWDASQVQQPARPLRLVRGTNDLWFLTIAEFDALGLDRVLLALADLALRQGRWEETRFDHALFYQDPAVLMRVTWIETEPASVQVQLPVRLVRRRVTARGRPDQDRDQFSTSVAQGVNRLRAAGVRSEVVALDFAEVQPTSEFLTGVLPVTLRDAGSTGGERMPDAGGVFGVTSFGDSTYR